MNGPRFAQRLEVPRVLDHPLVESVQVVAGDEALGDDDQIVGMQVSDGEFEVAWREEAGADFGL